jgi:hypothetical protein
MEFRLRSAAAVLGRQGVLGGQRQWHRPYVVVGIVYNVAVAVPLFRRFLSKNGASPRTGR